MWAINYHHFITFSWPPGAWLPDWGASTFSLAKCTYYFKIAVSWQLQAHVHTHARALHISVWGVRHRVPGAVHLLLSKRIEFATPGSQSHLYGSIGVLQVAKGPAL